MAADSARLCVIWCQHLRLQSLQRRIVCAARVVQRGTHVRDRALPWVYAAKCGSCASRSPSASSFAVFAAVFVLPRPCWHVSRALRRGRHAACDPGGGFREDALQGHRRRWADSKSRCDWNSLSGSLCPILFLTESWNPGLL